MGIVNQQPMAMDLPAGAFRTDEKEVQTKIHRFFFQNIISNKFRHHLNVIQQSQGVRHLWFFTRLIQLSDFRAKLPHKQECLVVALCDLVFQQPAASYLYCSKDRL
jgi:hypothetical protein